MTWIRPKRTHPARLFTLETGALLPTRSYRGDAGFDIYANEHEELGTNDVRVVDTGVHVNFPRGWYGLVQERGSQSLRGVFCIGNVVDEGFTGSIHVMLANLGRQKVHIKPGDRIGQLLLIPRFVDALDKTRPPRGNKKLGSSGP